MITRSERAKYAKSVFYSDFNDVDIYVEDTADGSKKIYSELLSRALGGQLCVRQIFPLGPKQVVISRCAADQGDRKRKAVYIVDGDYDLVSGVDAPVMKRLYRLKRYSVENYLCDIQALLDVMTDESVTCDLVQISSMFDFPGWEKEAVPQLRSLLTFCAAASVKPCGLPTVRVALGSIQGRERDHVCSVKIGNLGFQYEQAIDVKYGIGSFSKEKKEIQSRFCENAYDDLLRFIPAKNILLPLLISRARRKNRIQLSETLLRCKLARRCDVSEIADLLNAIS